MAIIENNLYLQNDFAEIEVITETDRAIVIVDLEDLPLIGKVRLLNNGYPSTKSQVLSRLLMGCVKGDGLYVDHIDGNPLNNRKSNLRAVAPSINARNVKGFSRNNTGIVGIQFRTKGNYKYYRLSIRDLEGKRITKHYNINVLGDEVAFTNAKTDLLMYSDMYGYLRKII